MCLAAKRIFDLNQTLVEMCSHLATERAGMATFHWPRPSSIPTFEKPRPVAAEVLDDNPKATTDCHGLQ